MRVIVSGDRNWYCRELAASVVRRLLDRFGLDLVVVNGGADGVDRAFAEAAAEMGVEVETHRADWERFGKRAGPRRNQEMVDAGAGMVVAVHPFLGNSLGTKDCVRQAMEAGIPVYMIETDRGEPKRVRSDDPRLGY